MERKRSCTNCGHDASSNFCPQCGQSTRELKRPVTKFLAEFVSEVLSFDSRLFSTMKPLFFKPGYVASEFLAGRRAQFVPPVRLYIFASFAMFLALALNGASLRVNTTISEDTTQTDTLVGSDVPLAGSDGTEGTVASRTPSPDSSEANGILQTGFARFAERFGRGLQRVADNPETFRGVFLQRMAQAMFVLLPVFALLLKITHPRRLYVEHLVYSVYFHAFVFLVITAINLPAIFGLTSVSRFAGLLQLAFPIYLFLGMRRLYDQSRIRTTLKFMAVCFLYFMTLTATSLSVLTITFLMA